MKMFQIHTCMHILYACPRCQPPCGKHGNKSLTCLVIWLMVTAPVLGHVVKLRQNQGPLGWTCNAKMGLPIHTHHTKGCMHLDPTIGLQCSNILSEFTLEFYACKIGYSISLGWIRGYFHGELGQSNRQFQECTYACMECM